MKKISFDEFCLRQSLTGEDKQDFKSWLKFSAFEDKFEHIWLRLFTEWLRRSPDKVLV